MIEIDPRITLLERLKSIKPASNDDEYWRPNRIMKGVLKMALSISPGRCATCKSHIAQNELYNDHRFVVTHKACRLSHEDIVKLLIL